MILKHFIQQNSTNIIKILYDSISKINVGINDLLEKTTESSEDLADRIIEIGMQSKEYGAKKIFISSIIISQSIEYRRSLEINELKDQYKVNKILFISLL